MEEKEGYKLQLESNYSSRALRFHPVQCRVNNVGGGKRGIKVTTHKLQITTHWRKERVTTHINDIIMLASWQDEDVKDSI